MSMRGDCMQANVNYIMVIRAAITGMTLNANKNTIESSLTVEGQRLLCFVPSRMTSACFPANLLITPRTKLIKYVPSFFVIFAVGICPRNLPVFVILVLSRTTPGH